jgi:hypothetical protein
MGHPSIVGGAGIKPGTKTKDRLSFVSLPSFHFYRSRDGLYGLRSFAMALVRSLFASSSFNAQT